MSTTTAAALAGLAVVVGVRPWPGWAASRGGGVPGARLGRRAGGRPSGRQLQLAAGVGALVIGGLTVGGVAGWVVGVGLMAAAMPAVAHLHARQRPVRPDSRLAMTLDLAAAALRAGQPVASALAVAAPAASGSSARALREVSGLLRLGAEPGEAWRSVADDPVLGRVARTAARSATSGARLAIGWEQLADELRAELQAAATARAHRAGVWAIAPLGLCFLPAFVCLGIVPVVVTVARAAFGGLGGLGS